MNNLTVNVYSWDEGTGLCPVHVSESSPFGNQCLGRHFDLFPIHNKCLTLTINFNRLIIHLRTLESGSKVYFNNTMKQNRRACVDFHCLILPHAVINNNTFLFNMFSLLHILVEEEDPVCVACNAVITNVLN